jgi:hypothetical protein
MSAQQTTNSYTSYDNDKKLNTITTILNLQQTEKQLFSDLETIASNPEGSNLAEQSKIIEKINSLSTTRINLFNTINDLYQYAKDNVSENRKELVDKMVVAKVMETQLNNMKQMSNELQTVKNNKLRMVQINTYYGKQYEAQTELMKLIVKICAIIIIIVFVSKMGFIPTQISTLVIIVIIGVGAFLIFRKISDLSSRDKMDFDRYDTDMMSSKDLSENYDYNKNFNELGGDAWSICGDGTLFNNDKGQCLVKSVEPFSIMNSEVVSGHDDFNRLSGPMEI